MSKPDASKQHKPGSIIGYREAIAHGNGPYRCNCELSFKSPEDAPADLPMHFCNPFCEQDTRQPLQNLLDKRIKRERGK